VSGSLHRALDMGRIFRFELLSLRRGDTIEAMTIERAQELLAGRRAWELENGGAPKKRNPRRRRLLL